MPVGDWTKHFHLKRITASTTYVPQIDGLRFLALLPVLFWHSGLRALRFYNEQSPLAGARILAPPHGRIGVYLFFFISGYIIAYPYFKRGGLSAIAFYKRRLMRLYPAYFVAAAACFFALYLSKFKPSHAPSFANDNIPLASSFLASLFYVHGLVFSAPPKIDPPLWSLEIEVQFYLIAPIIFSALPLFKNKNLTILATATIIFAIASTWLNICFGDGGWQNFTFVGYFYTFLLGITVSCWAVKGLPFEKPALWVCDIGFLIGVSLWVWAGYFEERDLAPYQYGLRTSLYLSSILLIYMGAARGHVARWLLGRPLISVIGGMCYSIYLVHVPLMQVVAEILFKRIKFHSLTEAFAISFGLLIPLSLLFGLVFFVLLERPTMDPRWPSKIWPWFTARVLKGAPARG